MKFIILIITKHALSLDELNASQDIYVHVFHHISNYAFEMCCTMLQLSTRSKTLLISIYFKESLWMLQHLKNTTKTS